MYTAGREGARVCHGDDEETTAAEGGWHGNGDADAVVRRD